MSEGATFAAPGFAKPSKAGGCSVAPPMPGAVDPGGTPKLPGGVTGDSGATPDGARNGGAPGF